MDDPQKIKAMLELAVNQRNNALNECLQLGAQLIAAQSKIAELERQAAKTNGAGEHPERPS